MLKVIILICTVGMEPAACNIHTAKEIHHGPNASTPMGCMQLAQITAAQSPAYDASNSYMKTMCVSEAAIEQAKSRDETGAAMTARRR